MSLSQMLQERKENIHINLRSCARKEALGKMRKQFIKCFDARLMDIIRASDQALSQEIIEDLIRHANADSQNAIIQIGNLIIDNKQVADYVKDRLVPLQNDYWSWLIMVIAKVTSSIKKSVLDWIVCNLVDSSKSLAVQTNSAQSLSQLTKQEDVSAYLSTHAKFLECLPRLTESATESIYIPAFNIFANLTSFNEQITASLIQGLGKKTPSILKSGLLKFESGVRLYACECLSNLALNQYIPAQLLDIIIVKSTKEKSTIVKELSFFFMNASEVCSFEMLSGLIAKGLVSTLLYYVASENRQLSENGITIIKNIFKRLYTSNNSEGFHNFYSFLENNSLLDVIETKYQLENDTMVQFLLS